MGRIMIGDCFVHPNDIVEIAERNVTLHVKKKKPNPKPKPSGFFAKALYSSTVTVKEENKYHILVLKVQAGTQTVLPDPNDHSDFSIGNGNYGTHKLYKFYTVCDNANLIDDAKAMQKELAGFNPGDLSHQPSVEQEERRTQIIKELGELGMGWSFGWEVPDFLDTSVLIDKSIKTKQNLVVSHNC